MNHKVAQAAAVLLLAGCEEEPAPVDEPEQVGACGEPTFGIEMRFVGLAETASGNAVPGALIELEDRQLKPYSILGSATSEADGSWQLDATEISSWPDCWLTLLDYRIVGSKEGAYGEVEVNKPMWESIQDESYMVDLTDKPVILTVE